MSPAFDRTEAHSDEARRTVLHLVVRWLWVAIPLAWGIIVTVDASLAFFG